MFRLEELLKVFSASNAVSSVLKGAMPKCLYGLGTSMRTNFLLAEAVKFYQVPASRWKIVSWQTTNDNFLAAMNFLSQRYLFGMMVVATSVGERSWCTISDDPKHILDSTTQYALQVLRGNPVTALSTAELFNTCLDLAWLSRRGDSVEKANADVQVRKVFAALQARVMKILFRVFPPPLMLQHTSFPSYTHESHSCLYIVVFRCTSWYLSHAPGSSPWATARR